MALMQLHIKSKFLNMETEVRIAFNQYAKPPYPAYYLLHGYSDNTTTWSRNSSIERYAGRYPFMVVMPDGAHGFYSDSIFGKYEQYIVNELIPFIDQMFPTRGQRRYRAIGGLSMGGYGAVKLGLKHHDVFGCIAGHSGAVGFMHKREEKISRLPESDLIAADLTPEEDDTYRLAERCPKRSRPHLYFDCGREDFLYEDNEDFHKHLTKIKYPHVYKRYAGAHNWEYWDEHIQDALKFVAGRMRLKC